MSGTYHYVITLQWPLPDGGMGNRTNEGTYTSVPGETRQSAFLAILNHTFREIGIRGASTIHFSLEPNAL